MAAEAVRDLSRSLKRYRTRADPEGGARGRYALTTEGKSRTAKAAVH